MSNRFPEQPVLLVDDEVHILEGYSLALKMSSISNIIKCSDATEVISLLKKQEMDVIVMDMLMPSISGQDLLIEISRDFPNIPVVMLTGVDEVETAVACIRSGAFNYLVKPVEKDHFVSVIKRAIEFRALKRENSALRENLFQKELKNPDAFSSVITNSATMHSVFQYIETIGRSRQPVLITGETGVGKELVSKAVHEVSRLKGSFVTVNAAGLDDNMFSDTLFGHKKGAFTGADTERKGLIEKAKGGTLFLDEIGDLSQASQVKLLRLLQEREFYPLGSDVAHYSDARVIVATNENLSRLIEQKKFRKDLYYRLSSHQISIPPLRERFEDLPLLVEHQMEQTASAQDKKKPTIPKELYTLLSTYYFPGNIRELENMVIDAATRHTKGMLSTKSFKEAIKLHGANSQSSPEEIIDGSNDLDIPFLSNVGTVKGFPKLKDMERLLVDKAMKMANDNQTIAAELLGITRLTLNKRLTRSKNSPYSR